MSTIIATIILIGFIISVCSLLIIIATRQKRKRMKSLMTRFSDLAIQNDLTISGQELLGNMVIGIDGLKKQLLIIDGIDDHIHNEFLIDLHEVSRCTVRKNYNVSRYQKGKRWETHLENIVLNFEFDNKEEPISIPFYKTINNHVEELPELELRAMHWEALLAKMIKQN